MEPRKQAILDALDAFVRQRSGMEFGNYGDVKAFRAEQRSVTRDLHDYRAIRRTVELRDSVTADMILEAARSAYSGRLTLTDRGERLDGSADQSKRYFVEYCTGQYFPTEYRKAACAVLASTLWHWTREHAMPSKIVKDGEQFFPHNNGSKNLVSAGDWLRTNFKREFGRHIASRYFD